MNPYHELQKSAGRWSDKTAFIADDGSSVTFAALLSRVETLAGALESAGIGKGDVVAVMLPNGIEFVELFLAAGAIGAVFQPMDIRFAGEELRYALDHTGAKVLVAHGSLVEAVEPGLPDIRLKLLVGGEKAGWDRYEAFVASGTSPKVPVAIDEDSDNAVYLYTSGTTESLKCVPMTWRQLDFFPADMSERLGLGPEDTGITLLPMSHISGPIIVSLVLSTGCSFVVTQRWRPDIIVDLFEKHRVTWTHSVPALADLILKGNPSGRDLSSVRFIALMGTRPGDDARGPRKSHTVVPGHPGVRPYRNQPAPDPHDRRKPRGKTRQHRQRAARLWTSAWSTETVATCRREPGRTDRTRPQGVLGIRRQPRTDVQRVPGRLVLHRRRGAVDTSGYLFHLGRLDDVINTGGLKVYPAEVENTLLKRPEIEEAVAYGVPDDLRGFTVAADVKLAEGCSIEKSDLHSFLVGELADYKIPRSSFFVDEIGHTATGKPVRKAQ